MKKKTEIVEDKKGSKTYTCFARFDDDEPELVKAGIENGIAFELTPSPNIFNLDNKKRIKHVGAMMFKSSSGKRLAIFLVEDKICGDKNG